MKQVLKYWFILIFAKPGNGKSLEQARLSEKVLREYHKTEKRYPTLKKRVLMTNQILNKLITDTEIEHGHLKYWEEPEEFRYCPRNVCWRAIEKNGIPVPHRNHDVDIFVDEGSTLFPADKWADTPIWLRKMFAQHRHNGIRFVMLTQDFKGIDINARRMIWQAYFMKKEMGSRDISPTLPALHEWSLLNPFNSVWGFYSKQRIDPQVMEMDPMTLLTLKLNEKKADDYAELKLVGNKEYHLITWHKVNLYDTTQDVKEYEVKREIEHIEVKCNHPNCGFTHKSHKLK